jgi:AcrR family transcriptional regulator
LETFYVFFVSEVYLVYFCGMIEELANLHQRVLSLYRKYGIKSVTMDDVSRELGISKKTLYQYVHDKDDLVRKVIELEISASHSRLHLICRDDLNAIEELVEISQCIGYMLKEYSAVVEYDLRKYYPDLYISLREVRRKNMFTFFQNNLLKGKLEGLFRENLDVEILTKLSVSHIDSMIESEVIDLSEFLEPKFFHEYFVYHLRGIVNEKGLDVLTEHLQKLETGKLPS